MTYSDGQVHEYFRHIDLPQRYRGAGPNLETLTAIQQHHLSHIPFDDVQIHYSTSREILLDPQAIFTKFVKRGHGGYCMEHNALLYHMLLSMGYTVYTTGARPQKRVDGLPSGEYYGWTQMICIVTLAGDNVYVVDVGYGGDVPTRPLSLVENVTTTNIGKQEMRLIKGNVGPLVNPSETLWTYQIRNGEDKPWQVNYVFNEVEFFAGDFRVMSYYTSTHPDSYMVNNMVATKVLMSKEGKVYGKIMLNNADLKRNTGGRTETIVTCKSEEERIEVLEKYFGIKLNGEERAAIKDSVARIP